jgi:hypothetical protein
MSDGHRAVCVDQESLSGLAQSASSAEPDFIPAHYGEGNDGERTGLYVDPIAAKLLAFAGAEERALQCLGGDGVQQVQHSFLHAAQ